MPKMSESDDEIVTFKTSRVFKKKSNRNKIDDSDDSSSDERPSNSTSKDEIENTTYEEDLSLKYQNDTNSLDSGVGSMTRTSDLNVSSTQDSECHVSKNSINCSDDDDSNMGESYKGEKIHEKKKEKRKNKMRCFADSSSDEEGDVSSGENESNRKSSRVSLKKSSFLSKLNKVKVSDDVDEPVQSTLIVESVEMSSQGEDMEDVEKPASSPMQCLQNNDLFDMEGSSDEELEQGNAKKSTNTFNDDEDNGDSEDNEEPTMGKKKNEKKEGKQRPPSKDAVKEAKSEQQRLLRQQSFKLPYHIPEAKPLKDFLKRVPVLQSSKKKNKEKNKVGDVGLTKEESKDKKGINCLFEQKPRLSFGNDEILEFEGPAEEQVLKTDKQQMKKKGVLDSFMARFEKHTRNPKKEVELDPTNASKSPVITDPANCKEDDKRPGGRRVAFKEQMKQKIMSQRCQYLKEVEAERKLYNEENEESESESESESAGKKKNVKHNTDSDEDEDYDPEKEIQATEEDDSSEDEEISKWNLDDEKKALEQEAEDKEMSDEKNDENTESVDFSVEPVKTSAQKKRDKEDMMQWDDTSSTVSSVLPAGQGDPTVARKYSSDCSRMTPFSKLIKTGLLDSGSKQNETSSSNMAPSIVLPCENTQDLYKDINISARQIDDEESESVFGPFKMFLNEESQYTQAIDSQGFLNDPNQKSRRQPAKRLFDEDTKEGGGSSFSQVIGLCSGKFENGNLASENEGKKDSSSFSQVIGLCSGKFESGNQASENGDSSLMCNKLESVIPHCESADMSMSEVIGLCSGRFQEEDTSSSSKNISNKANVCNENDGSLLSNPPLLHPFSCRFGENDEKDVLAEDCGAASNRNKPLGLSQIVDENFDDNAMDFCTAAFSQSKGKEEGAELPKPTFDVGSWLKNEVQEEKSVGKTNFENTAVSKKTKKCIIESDSEEDNGNSADNEEQDADDEEQDADDEEQYAADEEQDGADDEQDANDKEDAGKDFAKENHGVNEEYDDDSHDEADYDDIDEEINEELLEYQEVISQKSEPKKKWSKANFMEKEAELSGSDVGSGDEDLGSEYDEYEEDSDIENLPTEEKLKRQVHKIHQRKLIDEDERHLKLLQEMYLEDGDLGGGRKRQRNFRWKNIDNDNLNAGPNVSGDEEDELNLDTNIGQKLERAEREKYISELIESQKEVLDENSQSMLEMIKDPSLIVKENPPPKPKAKLISKTEGRVLSQKQLGSFLSQKKSSISHLSAAAKSSSTQGSKTFVFQATEVEKTASDKENKGMARKASFPGPAKKKMKVSSTTESSQSQSQSIFDLL